MADFLLVHGMFHGGWCWDRLAPSLESAGHRVIAPNLAGCGSDATPAGEVSLALWSGDVAALLARSPGPVVLVGHSRGGLVVSQAAESEPDKVAAIVYLTALMMPDGKSAINLPELMAAQGVESGPMMTPRLREDNLALLPPENAGEVFYGACAPEVRAWAETLVGIEPIAPMMTPLALTAERWGRLPKIYIETTEDEVLSIEAQRAMIAVTRPDEVITMRTGHMPILTDVPTLAEILNGIAERYANRA